MKMPAELSTDHELSAGELVCGYVLAILAALAYAIGACFGAAAYLVVGIPTELVLFCWRRIDAARYGRLCVLCFACSFCAACTALIFMWAVSYWFELI